MKRDGRESPSHPVIENAIFLKDLKEIIQPPPPPPHPLQKKKEPSPGFPTGRADLIDRLGPVGKSGLDSGLD